MSRPKRLAAACVAVAAITLVGSPLAGSLSNLLPSALQPSTASAVDELSQERAKLAALLEEAKRKEAQLAALAKQQTALQKQLADLQVAVAQTEASIAETKLAIVDTQIEIGKLDAQGEALRVRQASVRTAVGSLYRFLYEEEQRSGLEIFLGAGFFDWMTQASSTSSITGQLEELRSKLADAEAEAARLQSEREADLADLQAKQTSLATQETDLKKKQDETIVLIAQVAAQQKATSTSLSQVRDNAKNSSLTIQQLQREQDALAKKGTGGGSTGGGGSTPPSPGASAPPGSVIFYGRGTDHGVGLSQWGAYGRAKAGQDAATILTHYYQSTTVATYAGNPTVRVLLTTGFQPTSSNPARVYGRGAEWTLQGVDATFPADGSLTMSGGPGAWVRTVRDATGTTLFTSASTGDERMLPSGDASRFEVVFLGSTFDTYRGQLRLTAAGDGSFSAVSELDLERYLLGVVPAEVSSSWPAEALKAQAIAARGYARVHINSGNTLYDFYDDTRSQVYIGSIGERASTNAAVTATANTYVLYNGLPANTFFFSCGGGATENNENVWVSWTGAKTSSAVAYLRGSSDKDANGVSYDAASGRSYWQTRAYTYAELSAVFANDDRTNVGTITSITMTNRGVSGRLISVTLNGSAGSKTVSGSYFKYVFNVYTAATDPAIWSTLFATSPIP